MTDPSKPTPSAPVEVTQADRDAAAELLRSGSAKGILCRFDVADDIERGALDRDRFVQAFARHRLRCAPSGSDLNEGVAFTRFVCFEMEDDPAKADGKHLSLESVSWVDHEWLDGVRLSFDSKGRLISCTLRSTPSPTLTPDGDLIERLEKIVRNYDSNRGSTFDTTIWASDRDAIAEAVQRISATPAIKDQAFEEAARLIEQSSPIDLARQHNVPSREDGHDSPGRWAMRVYVTAIRALKGTVFLPEIREEDFDRGVAEMRRTLDDGFDDETAFRSGLIGANLMENVPPCPPPPTTAMPAQQERNG